MRNRLNLGAIFRERDLINGTGTHECKIARDTTPKTQECGCGGTTLCRCRFGAALRWILLLRLYISIWCIITAVVALGAISGVAVVGTSNKNGARIGNNLYLDDVQLSTTLGEGELEAPRAWVQPNPSQYGAVLVGASGAVQVVDLSGRVLWAGAAQGEALNLPEFPAGTYLVRTESGSLRWSVL